MTTTSTNGYKFIELWEGLRLTAYDDGTGTWTIGYGHTSAAGPPQVHRGMTITAGEATSILQADLASVEISVNHHVTAQINQNQFDAFVAFDFNTNALAQSSLLRDFNAGDLARIKTDFEMWDHAHVGGHLVVMPGLLRRRDAEYTLFSSGQVVGP